MDLDLRKLRYFAAVAEHRHFGRAAAQLYIAQPVLSRQVRALEQELGCTLLVRTTRSVELTPAGEQLRDEARGLFGAVDTAVRRVLEVERGVERLVVGFAPGLHVSEVVRAHGVARPDVAIDLLQLNWWEQDAPLRDGRVDVGHLRRPFDDTGLRTVAVGSEPRVACLSLHHPLAEHADIADADLEGHTVLNAEVRRTATLEEKFELVASGYGIALVPRSVAVSYSRPDVVHLPLRDGGTLETCVAVADDRRERRVLEFVDLAVETLRAQRVVSPARA